MELFVKQFEELTAGELFEILKLRVSVFVVEQKCAYQEIDDADRAAYHVWLSEEGKIRAYLRVLPAGTVFPEVSIGRVIAVERRKGLGSRILREGIRVAEDTLHADKIVLEAQIYARGLYEKAGFQAVSETFLEDGIPHIKMERAAKPWKLPVLVTLNAGYLRQLKVMLASLLRSNPMAEVTLYILHSSLTDEEIDGVQKGLREQDRVVSVRADGLDLSRAPITDRYPKEMYYRIFAAKCLPEELSRVIYLDPDIVVNGSLRELAELPMGTNLFAAATHVRKMMYMLNALRLDMDEDGVYINSGVMILNLELLRKEQDEEAVYRYIEEHKNVLVLPDQDVISGLYGSRILELDPYRYNMTERLFLLRPQKEAWRNLDWVREHSVVIHYCGRNKPWKSGYTGQLGVFYEEAEKLLKE